MKENHLKLSMLDVLNIFTFPPLSVFLFLGFCLLLTDLLSHFSTLYLLVFDLSSAGPKSRPTLSFCSNTDTPVSETYSRL